MITAGLKLTQSGGIALLNDGKLEFNVELQKLANNRRYCDVDELNDIVSVLADNGCRVNDIEQWVIDGWDGSGYGHVERTTGGMPFELRLAPYRETKSVPDPALPGCSGRFVIGGESRDYDSYVHVASHLAAAYCTSPFAQIGAPCAVLVWDGGCFPRLYYVDGDGVIDPRGEAFPLIGHTYSMLSQHWGPYRRDSKSTHVDDLAVAGKLMAYMALGTPAPAIKDIFDRVFFEHFEAATPQVREYRSQIIGCGSTGEPSHRYVHAFLCDVRAQTDQLGVPDDDILASAHEFIEELLIARVTEKIAGWSGGEPLNLCFAGGCALNIKWNTALRSHPMIKAMWVPPFPDDSGSAIGTACLGASQGTGLRPIEWQVRLGPALVRTPHVPPGWSVVPSRPEELARLLHLTGEPVVVLQGRAELGPRALGGRSILAPATDPAMKQRLNNVKRREFYRPVAPICLAEHAPAIFDPGTPDPYMLFEHTVRPQWKDRIPAVIHLDGTARLQTVSQADDAVLATILREYHKWSGIPVLCNTSANHNGRGFFPDAASAMEWGQLAMVWSDGVLYRRS
ncbi:MAG TPA: carbamoyltransferase N-terminal domain-containing protein [Streptosporangiaceae bacterium]|nr:carbamoyltransferase N-terminal domain-containing protein [Streptosporangiaceae bacterium]